MKHKTSPRKRAEFLILKLMLHSVQRPFWVREVNECVVSAKHTNHGTYVSSDDYVAGRSCMHCSVEVRLQRYILSRVILTRDGGLEWMIGFINNL
jgi:hypothetical protein